MPLKIEKVLVCDAVDKACVDLLQENGINVSTNVTYAQSCASMHVCVSVG